MKYVVAVVVVVGLVGTPAWMELRAADRDVQFRSIDFTTSVVELFNFGDTLVELDGWRFCTHDENQRRRYSGPSGFDGVSLAAGESLHLHFLDDAPAGPGMMNVSDLGGQFALDLDRGPYALQLYHTGDFGVAANMADYAQWNIDGADNSSADERASLAEGELWNDQNAWIATTLTTTRLEFVGDPTLEIHGPSDFVALTPILQGDYNGDGTVNAPDYNVWRDTFGEEGDDLAADGNMDDVINAPDYNVWRDNFGKTVAAVPEPSSLTLLVVLLVVWKPFRSR